MKKQGFTLVEVLIAIILVAIALFAVIALQTYTFKVQRAASDRHTAATLAAGAADEAILELEKNINKDVSLDKTASDIRGYSYSVLCTPDPVSSDLKDLEVNVFWVDDKDQEQTFTLQTKVVRR